MKNARAGGHLVLKNVVDYDFFSSFISFLADFFLAVVFLAIFLSALSAFAAAAGFSSFFISAPAAGAPAWEAANAVETANREAIRPARSLFMVFFLGGCEM